MRIFICKLLVKICNWILPESAEVVIPPIDGYTPSKVGLSLKYSDDLIKNLTKDMQGSNKEARRYVIEDAKKNICNSIFNALVTKNLIKFKVSFPKKGEINVSGELKVYVPNE